MTYGTVSHFEENATVRFERVVAASIDEVWAGLSEEERLSDWLAPSRFEASLGGAVRIDFGDEQKVDGHITAFAANELLEYTWTFTGEPDSLLRFELEADETSTRLILEHSMLPPEQAAGYGAGWHAHLDALAALLEGTEPVDWDERFTAVLGRYVGA